MERIEKLKSFLQESPGDSFLKHALALEYIKAGNDEEAQQLLESLLHNNPAYVGSYYHLGQLLERKKMDQQALQCYKTGMEQAKKAGEQRTYNELKSACDELEM